MKTTVKAPRSLVSHGNRGTSFKVWKVWFFTGDYARNVWHRDSDGGRKFFRVGPWALAAHLNLGSLVIATTVWNMDDGKY